MLRKSTERGHSQNDWLESRHSFSFGEYYQPEFMGFGVLRVINEDTVQPGKGFGFHSHHDMEIISYVIDGMLEHKDSMGTGSIIKPGDIQCMSAGSGVRHSEFNPSTTEPVHFLQIWIIPEKKGLTPNYQQQRIMPKANELNLIASGAAQAGIIHVNQDIELFVGCVDAAQSIHYEFDDTRCGWLQLIKGAVTVSGQSLLAGDGIGLKDKLISIRAEQHCEFLLFDLPLTE